MVNLSIQMDEDTTSEFVIEFVECEECGAEKKLTHIKRGDMAELIRDECDECGYSWVKPEPDQELKSAIGKFIERFWAKRKSGDQK